MTLLTSNTAQTGTAAFVSDERLYLDKDGNVVREGDPERVELLVGAGGTLSRETAAQYGLIDEAPAGATTSTPAAVTPPPSTPVVTPTPPTPDPTKA